MSLNRLQQNRSLNLPPILINKSSSSPLSSIERQTSSSGQESPVGPTLSPVISVNVTDLKTLLAASQLLTNPNVINDQETICNNNNNSNNIVNNQSNNTNNTVINTNQSSTSTNESELAKKCLRLRNYILFEPNNQNDTFSSAYNTQTNKFYFWKKFDEKDYMKRLEPYFIMEGVTDKVYKFKEIIIESKPIHQQQQQQQNSINRNAFVIFEQHYGDLHSYMKEKKKLEEAEAKHIFKQCVEAVHSCHENGIIIRDIKLKKFVFLDQEKTQIGLANLEDCLVLDEDAPNDLIKSQQGCPAYVSPEVLNPSQSSYSGRLSDSWSLGIILFTLLVGRYPFHHQTITNMFAKIARGRFQIPPTIAISLDAKLLLRSLIRVKPDERLLPNEILAHNWLKQTELDYQLHQQQFCLNESKFSPLQVHKIQLGISTSAPIRTSTSSNTSPTQTNNNLINNLNDTASKNRAIFRMNENMTEQDDRLVPEFKSN